MHERFKSNMYSIITPFTENLLRREKMFLIANMYNQRSFPFSQLCVKLEVVEQQGHKVVPVMLIEFNLLPPGQFVVRELLRLRDNNSDENSTKTNQ